MNSMPGYNGRTVPVSDEVLPDDYNLPWGYQFGAGDNGMTLDVMDNGGQLVFQVPTLGVTTETSDEVIALASAIECTNACQGIDPGKLKATLDSAWKVVNTYVGYGSEPEDDEITKLYKELVALGYTPTSQEETEQ